MSVSKHDRKYQSFSGISFSADDSGRIGTARFAAAIAGALRSEFGGSGSAIKTIVRLTTANERAVKNWYEGKNAPSGELLVLLCRHSDHVLETFLILAGRRELVSAKKLVDAKEKLREMLEILSELDTR